jgi:hypothetical protein
MPKRHGSVRVRIQLFEHLDQQTFSHEVTHHYDASERHRTNDFVAIAIMQCLAALPLLPALCLANAIDDYTMGDPGTKELQRYPEAAHAKVYDALCEAAGAYIDYWNKPPQAPLEDQPHG